MTQNAKMENSQAKSRGSKKKKNKNKEEEERKKQEERRQREAKREEDRRAKELRKKEDEEKRQREIRKKVEEEKRAKEQRRLEEELRRTRISQRRAKAVSTPGRRPSETLLAVPPTPRTPSTPAGGGPRASLAAPVSGPGSLQRSASFIKRAIEELGEKVLRRSLSFAGDLSRPGREARRSQWAASLTSLQEDAPCSPPAEGPEYEGVELRRRAGTTLPGGVMPPSALEAFGPTGVTRSQSLLLCGRHASAQHDQGLSTFSRRRLSSQGASASPGAGSPSGLHDAPALPGPASAGSLPWLHKFPPEEYVPEHPRYRRQSSSDVSRRSTKLRRQEAFKNDRTAIAGRSRSLTHIDALDGPGSASANMLVKGQDMDSRSEPDTTHDRLIVPAPEPPQVRRQKLARSQVSSSEYFSVSFEIGEPHEEFVPAEKGVSLADALNGLCAKRGVDLANAHVYVDSTYKAQCQCLATDVSLLGGKHVRVRAKDDKSPIRGPPKGTNNQFPVRKSAGSYRAKGGRFFSASTEDPAYTGDSSHEGSFKGTKTSKQRWSGLFGNSKDTKMESLVELLNSYTKQGLPRLILSDPNAEHLDESLFTLESDWKDIVVHPNQLLERQISQQNAIWELVDTELAYIRTLKVVTDLFLACLKNLQASNILNEIDTSRLFSNIINIYTANCMFWVDAILPMLRVARETNRPLDPSLMLDGFLKFDDVFHPYQKYCGEQLQCQLYCREKHQENEMFTAYLAWCETQKDCNRLRLMDILVKPMQRLTKYSLLLKAVQKHTQLEEQRSSLERMIRCVDEFVHNVNTTMRQREDHERLRGIIARIESYDVVDSKDDELEKLLRSYSELDLTSPMPGCHVTQRRYLLFESDLKFRDNTTNKMDVHCFLLTDMLLVCKAATKRSGEGRMRVVRQPFVVERLMVHELGRDPPGLGVVYLNEYRTATAAFILTSGDAQLVRAWADHIRKAQDLYAAAKLASMSTSMPPTQVVTRQPSALWNDDDTEEVEVMELDSQSCASLSMGGIASRSPRGGSSRGSRVSSLAHSHSGSMDMNEVSSVSSVSHSRGVSVENELRGSSLSSDEGIPGLPPLAGGIESSSKPPQPLPPSASPRSDRRSILCKSPTPNTLSVQVPVYSSLGQSLPNLSLATSPSSGSHSGHPNPPTSLLLVPPSTSSKSHHHHGLLSPGHRGVSYPPPSPPRGSLRRGLALSQSRNPPLIKTRHINSSCSSTVGSIVGSAAPLLSPTQGSGVATTSFDFDVPVIAGVSPPSEECPTPEPPPEINSRTHRHPVMKRLARTENRRYHTAGAIDDLKKQNSKDTSIHKRLSWNCGQGQHHGQAGSSGGPDPSGKCVSVESVLSSSGVSSTGSAQFGSLASGLEEFGSLDLEASSLQVVCENPNSCCCEPPSSLHSFSSTPSVEAVNIELLKTQLSQTPADPGGVNQTSTLPSTPVRTLDSQPSLQQSHSEGSQPPSRDEMLRIKDLMLSDSSIEASNV